MLGRRALIAASFGIAGAGAAGCSQCSPDREPRRVDQEIILPAELADDDALAAMSDWLALPSRREGRYAQQSSADRATGAPVEKALWDHGNRDFNNFVCRGAQASAPPIHWAFVFDLPECPEPYVEGLVMARFEGSGRLARLWLTAASILAAPPDEELVRIYVDDDPVPHVQVPLADMLRGGSDEIFAPPFGAGSSRYLAWYYPVAFAKKIVVSLDHTGVDDQYFHQTDVVLDRAPRARVAPAKRLPRRDDVRNLLRAGVPAAGTPHSAALNLTSTQPRSVELAGPATIVKARVRVARDALPALADVHLAVTWDDDAAPAIDMPLADLFAAWPDPVERSSLVLAAAESGGDVELSLALPMPFEKRAVWTLENAAGKPAFGLALILELADSLPAPPWGHLHVRRSETVTSAAPAHPIAREAGAGRLVGVCAHLIGHGLVEGGQPGHPFHFLEGDETIVIDGEPRAAGTGTEDYFNGAFYFADGASASPFAQAWGITPHLPEAPEQGRISACRWHVLGDAIDFASSLDMALEIGPGVPAVIDRFLTVAYLYR